MKKVILFFGMCLCLQHSFAQNPFLVNFCAGTEIYHDWVSDSTYKITARKIQHCSAPFVAHHIISGYYFDTNSVDYFYLNPSIDIVRDTLLPDGRPAFSRTLNVCFNYPSQCDSPVDFTRMYGYREVYYSKLLTLPKTAGKYRYCQAISDGGGGLQFRDSSNTNIKLGGPTNGSEIAPMVESGINASNWNIRNRSARLDNQGPYYAAVGKTRTINYSATDPDGDSLVYHIIPSKDIGGINYVPTLLPPPGISEVPFINGFSLAEPFATNGTYRWDSTHGRMSFVPSYRQNAMITLQIDEYRNGQWVGSNMHDMPIEIIQATAAEPNLAIVKTSQTPVYQTLGDTIVVCPNKSFSVCYELSSSDVNAKLKFQSNLASRIPNATVSLSNTFSANVTACITWTPTTADAGLHTFYLQTKDTNCTIPRLNVDSSKLVHIKVLDGSKSVCWPANTSNFQEVDIQVFPNPAKEKLFIESPIDIAKYSIFDMVGHLLVSDVFTKQAGISVHYFSNGMYVLKIENQNGQSKMVKFVKE